MVDLSTKAHLSIYFASASALFARNAYAAEQNWQKNNSEAHFMEHRSYCIGAVIASTGFLEAAINELYLQAIHRDPNVFKEHMQLAELMEHIWDTTEQQAILAKFQIGLTLAKMPLPILSALMPEEGKLAMSEKERPGLISLSRIYQLCRHRSFRRLSLPASD